VRILLDECVDWRLGRDLTGHEVRTVQQEGWAGITNGELLARAQSQFDILLTTDQNLQYEQEITSFAIAVVVLCGKNNLLADLRPLISKTLSAIQSCKPGTITKVTM
jgi:predicted nuclease of predicted toxin-antitoxin system